MRKKRIMYLNRGMDYVYNSLYVKLSEYIGDDNKLIGHGLFSNVPIAEDTIIGRFKGSFINNDERQIRIDQGHGGYFIYFNQNETLDCYENRMTTMCKLSYANSYVNATNVVSRSRAIQNGKLVVNHRGEYATIRTTRKINPHEEIFINYGDDYENVQVEPIHLSGDSL
jgi:hypothetical protein